MIRVINFSGGKTSAYMTIMEYKQGDIVLFCDTGREHPKTYKFINDFEAYEGIEVKRISYMDSEKPFDELLKKTHYKRIPYRMNRFCTEQLKVNTAKRYLKSIGVIRYENLIGFRSDEPVRVKRHIEKFKKVKTVFPLYDKGIDKQTINDYWTKKPYTLEIPSILGNCTLCFMKGQNAILYILRSFPELADPWIQDEERSKEKFGHTYFKGITIKQMKSLAQNHLFREIGLEELTPAFDCACTV